MDAYVNLCLRETDLGWMTGEFDLDYLSKISHVITSDDIFRKLLQDRTKKDQNMMKSRRQTVSGMWRTGLTDRNTPTEAMILTGIMQQRLLPA